MPSHAIHTHKILRNVAAEVIYENNPVFAGENISVIIRFKHLGQANKDEAQTNHNENANGTQPGKESVDIGTEWFGKKLSMQLSNTARSLFLEDLNKGATTAEEDAFNKPVDLFSGYVQLSGVFTFNENVIDHEKFDQVHKKTTVSGKIGGLQGLEVSKHQNDNLLGYISTGISGLFGSDIQSFAKEQEDGNEKIFEDTKNLIPFFSTNQSLLFSSLNLKPGDIKNFYFNCKLPRFLPPSYSGRSIKINYKMIIGSSVDTQTGLPKPLVLNFPLSVSPFFNENGYQPVYDLSKFLLLQSDSSFVEPIEEKTSFKQLKKHLESKREIDSLSLAGKRKIFISRIKELQKNSDNNEDTIDNFKKSKVRDNITHFNQQQALQNSFSTENDQQEDKESNRLIQIDGIAYERQITKFQNQYLISREKKFICSLTFSKAFYKVGDSIKIQFIFNPPHAEAEQARVTGVLISLESMELVRDSFSVQESQHAADSTSQSRLVHFCESFSVFNTDQLPVNIPIPINATSQFKTNIFENKWSLVLKFILCNEESLALDAHKDSSGVLQTAKDSLGGFEFNCRLPLLVVPSDQELGGIPTK